MGWLLRKGRRKGHFLRAQTFETDSAGVEAKESNVLPPACSAGPATAGRETLPPALPRAALGFRNEEVG